MHSILSGGEFMEEMRSTDERVKNMRLRSIEVDRHARKLTYDFICDSAVDENLKNALADKALKYTPQEFRVVEIKVTKIVSNTELIVRAAFNYIKENYPSVGIFLKPTDIVCAEVGGVFKYTVRLSKDGAEYFKKGGAVKRLNDYLGKNFCSDFAGGTEEKEPEETVDLSSDEVFESQLSRIEHRTIKVKNVRVIDDENIGDTALYIEDADKGDVTVCGRVTEIAERMTRNDKPFFIIHLDDGTGRTSGVYFSKKNTLSKIKEIKEGDAIIARGRIGEYNGRRSFTFDKINRCDFPEDFVKKDKFKKRPPAEYSLIFPEPATTVKVKSVFDEERTLPEELTSKTYVVFDLETTGIEVMTNGITEIGAVKIKGGKIAEQFTTLVKPDYPIPENIIKLTGITPEMVQDAPRIGAVIPDFMKFTEGAVLVAQNADFDLRFIKRFAGAEEYDINNPVMDTMEMSRKYLPQLRRNDLHTLAEHFGIVFHHHRALADAYATAEIFIELMILRAKEEQEKR